jgi:hypothetical protein
MAAINGTIDLIVKACAGGPKTVGQLRRITGLGKQQVNAAVCLGNKLGTVQRIGRKGRYKYLPAGVAYEEPEDWVKPPTDGIVERALASRLPMEEVWR